MNDARKTDLTWLKYDPYEAAKATDAKELERQIMSANAPKSEREWWAMHEIEWLRSKLQSIATNTCCDSCQEAALVARNALDHCWSEITEPDYLAQCAETLDAEGRQKWFRERTADADRFGCPYVRQSIHPGEPRILLVEGWKHRPENEGTPRWQMMPVTHVRWPEDESPS